MTIFKPKIVLLLALQFVNPSVGDLILTEEVKFPLEDAIWILSYVKRKIYHFFFRKIKFIF